MVSQWDQVGMRDRLERAIDAVHLNNPHGHHFGRPFVSSYQLAIALVEEDPDLVGTLGKEVGGRGTGVHHHSLAQYIGNVLSKQIAADPDGHWAEGVFMSNERVKSIVYQRHDAPDVESSLTGTDFDMALFRRRQ